MELPTREQFLLNRHPEIESNWQHYGPPAYKCPKCSEGGMCKDLMKCVVLAVLPPIHEDIYHCNNCGYEETIRT